MSLVPSSCDGVVAGKRKGKPPTGTKSFLFAFSGYYQAGGTNEMTKYLLIAATMIAVAAPAMADEVGVHVGPVGAGVTVGAARDRDRDRTTVIKERAPGERTTVIKKENEDGTRSKTVIHERE
jgi:hypothetical protein